MARSYVVVPLLLAVVTAFAPDENMKMMRMGAASTPQENVKMIRKAVTISPNAEIETAVEVEKQLVDITQDEDTEGESMGNHSDAFETAHAAIVAELELKKSALADWLSQNCINTKTRQRDNKKKELSDYRGENANAWWQKAWSWIKRAWQNLFHDKENRLVRELNNLEAQLKAMIAEKEGLEAEVSKLMKAKDDNKGDARVIRDSLNAQVAAEEADIQTYKKNKKDAKALHADIQSKKTAEHKAAENAQQAVIDEWQRQIYAKRDVFYSLTATCDQYTKKGSTICKKCSGGKACGDTCIAKDKNCRKDPGCACNDVVGHKVHQDFNTVKKALEDIIKDHQLIIDEKTYTVAKTEKEMKQLDEDKTAADLAYDTETNRLKALKVHEEKLKATAEREKKNTKEKLDAETEKTEAAVTKLEAELQTGIKDLKLERDQEKQSKTALLAAQEAIIKELLQEHADVIADWDAKTANAKTEKARLKKEADDLSAAIKNAAY